MTPAARASAAIEVLADIDTRKRPASEALKDWGLGHRFAGSGDRAAIGNLVFDVLRKRASAAYAMGEDRPRALVLRTLVTDWGMTPEEVEALCDGSRFAPEPLTEAERAGLAREIPADAPAHIRGDYPEWLAPQFAQAFGARAAAEGAALAMRAPVDLRVNTLKATREKVLKALHRFAAKATPYSPVGVRIAQGSGPARSPHVEAEPGHGKGWFEVQDEGSQVASLLSSAAPRQQAIDLCAGAGGKTLALAALMENTGQLYAYDTDRFRLRPIFERLKRAGARNVQVLPAGESEALRPLAGKMDLVTIDAPCTGSGVWRRRPDAKWRLSPEMLEARRGEQRTVLDQGAALVKPGGRLAYITCSVLPQENRDQVDAFLARHDGFKLIPWPALWEAAIPAAPPPSAEGSPETLLMTPLSHGTDGFFVAVLERRG
ncbi:MAG: RsmB/NOP family class I SAM-dependent RNA methyltransferase [Methyloceanibacter sp.]|uniref:RsmB/NOP family class I SAM-dependent RNA methyltransferase n=1 Tax=Methyloceanibacter sp. TaxID=1965321 RepID=UPI003D6D1703